jgi:alpha-L-glutamate ligase-like protein
VDDKFLTKKMLKKGRIPHPRLLGVLLDHQEVNDFDFLKLEGNFVIKPAQGLGGNGILIIKKKGQYAGEWLLMDGRRVRVSDLRLHALDIVEGRYSRNGIPDMAIVEERVRIHPKFVKLGATGTPDVRVIVFNRVPVMAMLRMPTAESNGKANLHQGAVGLGIDMATGITTFGVCKDRRIKYFSWNDKKVNGISVPFWKEILVTAIKSQIVSKCGYVAVDMLLDAEKGPMVVELNDQPGLSIQLANKAGLKKRLDRVEGLEVETVEQGVNIGRTLFASKFASRVRRTLEGQVVVRNLETVEVYVGKKKRKQVLAKVDTGAYSTSIDRSLARELGLLQQDNIIFEKEFKSALGKEKRMVIRLVFWLGGRRVVSRAGISDRHNLRRKILIGRRDLKGFLIDPLRYRTDYKLGVKK